MKITIVSQFLHLLMRNKFLTFFIVFYCFFVFVTLGWGVPNRYHPFLYHMDEWHQLMALKAIVKHGTTTIPGAAQIPFVYPVLSGIYLIPFILLHIIDPFSWKSPVEDLVMQERLFEILRSVNIFFGVGSILLISSLAKKFIKTHYMLTIFLFTVCPCFLLLSTYFKYDIGLLFWIIISIYFVFRYAKKPQVKNFLLIAISSGIAMGTKFSAAPLLLLFVFAFFWFTPKKERRFKVLIYGLLAYGLTFIIVGVPNLLIGKADYQELLYSNLVETPNVTDNFLLPYPWWAYILLNQLPILFGQPFYYLSVISFGYFSYNLLKNGTWKQKINKPLVFLILSFCLFLVSLVPLKIWATNNRILVLLPFMVLMVGAFITEIFKKLRSRTSKIVFRIFLIFIVLLQVFETGAWIYAKYHADIQKDSSSWIENHIPKGTTIGIEDLGIYQQLPNVIENEFYLKQYNKKRNNQYHYQVITDRSKHLPQFIVITNGDVETKLYLKSPKKSLLQRIAHDGYKPKATFNSSTTYLDLFTNPVDAYFAAINASPASIVIYEK